MPKNEIRIQYHKDFTGSGNSSTVSWARLIPYLKKEIRIKDSERITGLIITEDAVRVVMEYKDEAES